MTWEAAILAGGRARRLGGQDKGALRVGAGSILERQVALLRARTSRVTIVGGPPDRALPPDVTAVPDAFEDLGPIGGLYTALARARADRLLVLACDLPFVTGEFLEYLVLAGPDAEVVLPRDDRGLHPLCAAYAASATPVIREAIERGVRKVRQAIAPLRLHLIEGRELAAFDPHGRLLHNVNTPGDYERALHLLG